MEREGGGGGRSVCGGEIRGREGGREEGREGEGEGGRGERERERERKEERVTYSFSGYMWTVR